MISTNEIYNVLLFEFPYFKKINEERRQLLCKRTQEFLEGTQFIPRKDLILTDRMKILISACSQQITLGFKKHYEYVYFEKIIVYPEKYLSTYTGKYHTGEMNTVGVIVFSWEDFYKGITVDNDAHNVGLHEFAHALEFMDIANKDIDETFSACLDKFSILAAHYLKHQPDKPLFRSYATTNSAEFFAVATEYYFEAPDAFRQKEPGLFAALDNAYQQHTKLPAYQKNTVSVLKPSDKVFGNYNAFLNYFGEVLLYMATIACMVAITMNGSPIGAGVFGVIAFYLMFTFLFKDSFTLYENYVQIHQSLKKQIVTILFPSQHSDKTTISYADVLYVTAGEFDVHTSGSLDILLNSVKQGYRYSLCYYQNGTIHYAGQITTDLDYDRVLRFLYTEKKVATRLEGKLKKY